MIDSGGETLAAGGDGFDRQLFTEMIAGFALVIAGVAVHEIILDDAGRPVDYRFLQVNPEFEKLTGLHAGDILGKRVLEVIPDLEPEWIERYGRVALTGVPDQFESYSAGLGRHFLVRSFRPAPGQLAALFIDVTERTRAEAGLRERNAFTETIISSAGEGLIVHDRELRFVFWNPAMEELTALSADQVLGGNAHELFPEIMAKGVGEDLARALAGESPTSREYEYEVPGTGRRGWVVQTNRPHRNADGEVVGVVSSVRNITAEHEIDAAIRRSEEQFRAIFDGAGDGILIHRPDGRIVEVNRVICEQLGYQRDEMIGISVADINAPSSAPLVPQRLAAIMNEGFATFEAEHLRRDGTLIPIEVVARRIEFAGLPAVLSIQRDIGERKRAQETVREQARFLQQLIDAIPIPITSKDRDGRIQLANTAFAEGPGLARPQIVGKTLAELGMPSVETHTSRDDAVLRGEPGQIYEASMRFADGSIRRQVITKAPLKSEDGEITGIATAAVDITARYEAEQALRLSEARWRTLFERAGDAIFISDLTGRFFEANQTACDRLGYRKDELIGMSATDIDTPENAALVAERIAALRQAGGLTFETAHRRRDGTVIPIEMISTMIELGGQPAVMSIARDISDRKRSESERAALEAQLRQSQKMEGIGQLAGGIAHDFNNLLTAIRGYASLALRDLESGADARQDIEQVEHSADRAAALTRQLLAFARRTVLQPEVVDLGARVRSLEPMLGRLLGEDISLVTVTPPAHGAVLADPGQVEQVIVNLAVNARDAMPDGGVLTIETGETYLDPEYAHAHGVASPGRYATLTVSDTGTGMSDDTLSHVFEPFFTTKGPGKGTGLGLATVYGIVRQSGGAVTATSELGRGSAFTVFLPLVESGPRAPAESHAVAAQLPTRSGTVLVVEDDDPVRGFATRVLERAGYTVVAASGGAAALEAARGQTIDLLLTDVIMPTMSGREVADRLASFAPGVPVLFVSGHDESTIVRRGVLDPNIRYLAKPFTAEALVGAVDDALAAGGRDAGRPVKPLPPD
jgi:PAS domain S-box-containing protein